MKSSTIHGADFDKIKENIKFLHDTFTRRICEMLYWFEHFES